MHTPFSMHLLKWKQVLMVLSSVVPYFWCCLCWCSWSTRKRIRQWHICLRVILRAICWLWERRFHCAYSLLWHFRQKTNLYTVVCIAAVILKNPCLVVFFLLGWEVGEGGYETVSQLRILKFNEAFLSHVFATGQLVQCALQIFLYSAHYSVVNKWQLSHSTLYEVMCNL